MDPLPTKAELTEDLMVAAASTGESSKLRRQLRRRTNKRDPERQKQLEARIGTLERHGSVLRSHLKRSDHHSGSISPYSAGRRSQIKRILASLRYERRQLRKMLPP